MCAHELMFFPSDSEKDNEQIKQDLRELSGIYTIRVIVEGAILSDFCEMPILQTAEGKRLVGPQAIHSFAQQERARA